MPGDNVFSFVLNEIGLSKKGVFMEAKQFLCYEDFGAFGDGKHDDIDAIVACHNEANLTNTPVKTKDGATYYIGGKDLTAIIKTDVDFGKSRFIIDDRRLENIKNYIFEVASDYPEYEITIDSLSKEQKTIDIPHEGNIFVRVYNDNERIFIRKGLNMNNGTPPTDCFIVDNDGNIFPSIDWDYPTVTHAYAKCVDDTPITIRGGIFTTIANEEESFYNYHRRGFLVKRSHVTFTGYEHYVENEGDHGAPYHGFVCTQFAYDVTFSDAIVTPRLIYFTASKIPGRDVSMGSYDFSFWNSIDIKCKNLKQTIDITDTRYWGIYTSNFCKNLSLENCELSRFDAHQGVTNVKIKNCILGHQCIQLIGHGDFLIEDSTVISNNSHFIYLRCDYGSIWDGDITIRNCVWKTKAKTLRIIGQNNCGDHNYGYTCMMGNNITIDGLKILNGKDTNKDEMKLSVFSECNGAKSGLPYKYNITKNLTLSNITVENGADLRVTYAWENFAGLVVTEK